LALRQRNQREAQPMVWQLVDSDDVALETAIALPFSSLTNVDAYQDPHWMELFHDLGTYSRDVHIFSNGTPPNIHRKGWEWTQTVWGLERLGMLQPQYRGIGIGAGCECIIFWLGDRLAQVVATDLYGNEHWIGSIGAESDDGVLVDPQSYCPRPINTDVIDFRVMNGTDLKYPDGEFDFSWSLSSIEHFGSHDRAGDAVREMARVVRPGGIVAVATEYLLLQDQEHPEYFNRQGFQNFVLSASPELELVEEVDWTIPPVEYLIDSVVLPAMADKVRRHVVLTDGHVQWTSILVFLRKRG